MLNPTATADSTFLVAFQGRPGEIFFLGKQNHGDITMPRLKLFAVLYRAQAAGVKGKQAARQASSVISARQSIVLTSLPMEEEHASARGVAPHQLSYSFSPSLLVGSSALVLVACLSSADAIHLNLPCLSTLLISSPLILHRHPLFSGLRCARFLLHERRKQTSSVPPIIQYPSLLTSPLAHPRLTFFSHASGKNTCIYQSLMVVLSPISPFSGTFR